MNFNHKRFVLSGMMCFLCLVAFCNSAVSQSTTISEGMQKRLPEIIKYLNDRELKTVGVLKFRVKKPGQKTSASVGPMNSLLADRLELGMVLGNPFDESSQLKIIEDASSLVAKIDGGNHLTEEGRAKIFGTEFPIAWGEEKAIPDAFLTGIVAVHDDNLTATVGILCFSKAGGGLERIGETFTAEFDAASLSEAGESFMLRGVFDNGKVKTTFKESQQQKQTAIKNSIKALKSERVAFPLNDADVPVNLQILYDGVVMPVDVRGGNAFVRNLWRGKQCKGYQVLGKNELATKARLPQPYPEFRFPRQLMSIIDRSRQIRCDRKKLNRHTAMIRSDTGRKRRTHSKSNPLSMLNS